MIQIDFLLLLCIAVVTAPAPAPPAPTNPPCVNTFKPATNFDLAKFSVTWYAVRQIRPGEGKCLSDVYTTNPADQTLNVTRVWIDSSGKPQKNSGTAKTSGTKPTEATLTVTFGPDSVVYTIFHLNSGTVFGLYFCIYEETFIAVFARTRTVEDSLLKEINDAITAAGLDPKLLKPSPRGDCPPNY